MLEEMKYEKKPINLGATNHFEYVVNIKKQYRNKEVDIDYSVENILINERQ